jgi:hypothetical protein
MARFSKATLQAELQAHIDSIQALCGFDPSKGSSQIPAIAHVRGDLMETALFYGQFILAEQLSWEYELSVQLIPKGFVPKTFSYEGTTYTQYVSGK